MSDISTCVEIYAPSENTAPIAYIFDKALGNIAERVIGRSDSKKFLTIGQSILYYDSTYGQERLFSLANNTQDIAQTMALVRGSLENLFTTDVSFDFKGDGDKTPQVPLAQKGFYKQPEFLETTATENQEVHFVEFLHYIGNICPTPSERFNLIESIVTKYLPMHYLRKIG